MNNLEGDKMNRLIYLFLLSLALSVLLFSGCSVKDAVSGFFSSTPNYWTDQDGAHRPIVFAANYGSDLYDAYAACAKNWTCYQAYFAVNRETYKKRLRFGRGQIRLYSRQDNEHVYAEYKVDPWTEAIRSPLCFLTLEFDGPDSIVSAEYEK